MNRMGRTYHHTLTTELALSMVDIGEVVGNRDSLKLTLLEAERTADAGISSMMNLGQALTQAPQATHLSSIITGSLVSLSIYIASNSHACTQSAIPRHPQRQAVSPL